MLLGNLYSREIILTEYNYSSRQDHIESGQLCAWDPKYAYLTNYFLNFCCSRLSYPLSLVHHTHFFPLLPHYPAYTDLQFALYGTLSQCERFHVYLLCLQMLHWCFSVSAKSWTIYWSWTTLRMRNKLK